MKTSFTFFLLICLLTFGFSQTTYTWTNSASGGAWNSSSNWTPNTGFPGTADNAVINPTAAITITNVPAISISSITVAGTAPGNVVTLTSAATDTLTINQNVTVNGGGIVAGANLAFKFISCSSYIHNMDGGTVPSAAWATGSNCNIIGTKGTGPVNLSQTFYNFLWDCQGQTAFVSLTSFPTGINGTCEMRRCGPANQYQVNWSNGGNYVWAGDLISSCKNIMLYSGTAAFTLSLRDMYLNANYGGNPQILMDNTSAIVVTVNVRNLNISGGRLSYNGTGVDNTTVNLTGDLTMTGGTISVPNSGYANVVSKFNFAGTTQQNVNITGSSIITGDNSNNGGSGQKSTLIITALSGSVVNFNTPLVCNLGGAAVYVTFTAAAGSTLMIPDANGIVASAGATTGSVRVPSAGSSATFNAAANYIYTGSVSQVTGAGLPATVNNFTVNNTSATVSGVTLTNNLSINGAFSLTSGNVTLGAKNITLLTPATLSGTFSVANMIVANSTGQFIRSIPTGSGSYLYPVGDATPYYSPVSLNLLSNSTAGTIAAQVANSTEANNSNPSAPSSYLSRYWTFANTGLTNYSYTGTFSYPTANITGTESEIKLSQWTGSSWFQDDAGSSASSGQLTITQPLNQATAALTGDFTGRVQTAATCTAPALNVMANGTANSVIICAGGSATTVSLTANPASGSGCTGTFQYAWFNGTNYWNGTSFASSTPVFNSAYSTISYSASVSAVYTASGVCSANTSCISSSSVTVNLPVSVTPSLTISTEFPSINSGTPVTFIATPVNGGSSPSYQWKKNNVNVGTNSNTYTDSSLSNSDVIICTLTSNASCTTTATATSNSITMSVFERAIPLVTINATQITICASVIDTFTATAVNGGTQPSYQWWKNGVSVGTNSSMYIDNSLNDNDVVYCVLTSNANCLLVNADTSNSITLTGNSGTPSITISASGSAVCAGTTVSFIATASNGGGNPTYSWKINGGNTGTNSPNFASNNLQNNDTVTCVLTPNNACSTTTPVSSNIVVVTVSPASNAGAIAAQNDTICSGDALSLSVTGSLGNIQWQSSPDAVSFTDINTATDTAYLSAPSQSTFFRVRSTGASCNDTSATLQIVVNALPTLPVVTSNDTLMCSGDSTQVCVSDGYNSYHWSNGATSSCTYANVAGGYWVTVTGTTGCPAISDHLHISVLPVPSVSIIVHGDTLSSYGASDYQWYVDGTAVNGANLPVFIASQGGDYSVQITDTNGCHATSTSITVTGIIASSSENNIQVYPNPSLNGDWQLHVDNSLVDSKLEVYDDSGRLILQSGIRNTKSEIHLDTEAGIYLLRIYTANKNIIRRLIRVN